MSETTPDDPAGRRAGGAGHPTPVFGVPASAFRRFRATVLSPDDAVRRGAEPPVHPTAYRPDRLILPGLPGGDTIAGPLAELKRLGEQKVQPGMQTDMFIITGERTFLGYLFQPLADSFNRAWRER